MDSEQLYPIWVGFIALLIILIFLLFLLVHSVDLREQMMIDAVKRGYAEWNVTDNGTTSWSWKDETSDTER